MNILFLCGREVSYPLNQMLLDSFRQYNQVDVIDEQGRGKSILKRSAGVLLGAIPKLLTRRYDLIFIGFFGHFLMLPVRLFTRAPILFHPFISTYETMVLDRKNTTPDSLAAKLAFWLDRSAFHAADSILLDTQANVRCFSKMFAVPLERFRVVFMGSDEKLFTPHPSPMTAPAVILYHGSFLPLQGIDVIIEAARRLKVREDIRIRLLGRGLEYDRIYKLVQELGLTNVEFAPAVPLSRLPEQIDQATVCLGGHFGTSDKAARVIAGKTFQDIAMGKATIVGENEANRELLTHGVDAWFCPMNDAGALAEGIITLVDNPTLRDTIGSNAREMFFQRASLRVLAPQVQQVAEWAAAKRTHSGI